MKKYIFISSTIILVIIFLGLSKNPMTSAFSIKSFLEKKSHSDYVENAEKVTKPYVVGEEETSIDASSYLVLDYETLSPILAKDSDKIVFVGSLTKLMTAVVALEEAQTSSVVTINSSFKNAPENRMGIMPGEKITLENLLYGLLIYSSNDAAEATAMYVSNGKYFNFVNLMNKKAATIGMKSTHFSNAMGIDNEENYSTAEDLAYLAAYALKNPFIADVIKIKEKDVASVDGRFTHHLVTTNKLLYDEDLKIFGIKTGTTPLAGECLISLAENNSGNKIITVILGSYARFDDAKKLITWTWDNVEWR